MALPPRLLLIHLAGALGGAERTSALLLRYLQKTQVASVTVVGSALLEPVLGPYCERYIDGNALGLKFWFTDWAGLYQDVVRVASIVKETTPDIALGMMHYGAALAVLGGRRGGRRMLRTVANLRGPAYEHIKHYEATLWRRLFLRTAIGITGYLADRVLVPSPGTGVELTRRFLVPSHRIELIPNGIDPQVVHSALQETVSDLLDLPVSLPVLCAVARISAEKNLGLLLDAFGRVYKRHPAILLIIGDGPDRKALEAKAEVLGLSTAVRFLGYRANVFPYLNRAAVFIHTCQFEGFGNTMLEAMACGVPVVATDCPYGPREMITEGKNGLLVPQGDPEALAQSVLKLLDDPMLRSKLALGAKAHADTLSVERMMAGYADVFHRLAPRH